MGVTVLVMLCNCPKPRLTLKSSHYKYLNLSQPVPQQLIKGVEGQSNPEYTPSLMCLYTRCIVSAIDRRICEGHQHSSRLQNAKCIGNDMWQDTGRSTPGRAWLDKDIKSNQRTSASISKTSFYGTSKNVCQIPSNTQSISHRLRDFPFICPFTLPKLSFVLLKLLNCRYESLSTLLFKPSINQSDYRSAPR